MKVRRTKTKSETENGEFYLVCECLKKQVPEKEERRKTYLKYLANTYLKNDNLAISYTLKEEERRKTYLKNLANTYVQNVILAIIYTRLHINYLQNYYQWTQNYL